VNSAELSGPVTIGRPIEPASPVAVDLAAHGYVEEEYFASGTAASYRPAGALGSDGRWSVVPDERAAYRTRVVVRRPADERAFNGTVALEWLNVSGGIEACADWSYLGAEMVRQGYAYVAVSAQALGIEGGRGLVDTGMRGQGLRHLGPERYGSLHHPGDRFAYDIVSQVALALRPGSPALGPLRAQRVLAVGESQSAMFLTSYIDALAPVHGAFDGYLVHSRGGWGAALDGTVLGAGTPAATRIRDDLDVPVFVLETETDLGDRLNYGPARQGDTERYRAWEVAGTAHADAFLMGPMAHLLGCTELVNEGPHHEVAMAALRALHAWVVDGTAPPTTAPLELASTDPPLVARDAWGNALGGVRTPHVDAPVAALRGDPPAGASDLCSLFGQTLPFDLDTLVRRYGDEAGYLVAHDRALDAAVVGGFVLVDDRDALVDRARSFRFPAS